MISPAISIVMVFFNAEQYIKESIKSVLNQSFQDYELLLINDGSTDNSIKFIDEFKDERINIIHNCHDFIKSLNIGLEKARGKYIARMDADDIMHPDRLLVQYSFMEDNPRIDFCSSWCTFFEDRTGKTLLYNEFAGYIKDPLVSMLNKNIFTHPCMMFKTDFIKRNNLRYQYYIHAEDYKMWVEAAKLGANFYIEPQSLLCYRCHKKQISTIHRSKQEETSSRIKEEIMDYLLSYIPNDLKDLYECLCSLESKKMVRSNFRFALMYELLKYNKIII